MTRRFSSISVQTTLATGISNTALSMVCATGTASTLLGGISLTAGNVDQFKIIIDKNTASKEIMYVTGVTSDTLTIQRGKDGTSAVTHSGGATIEHVLTGEDLTYFTTGVVPTSDLATGLPFPGSTSGTNTLKAPAVTGTVTNTLPATTGTLMSAESVGAATSKSTPVDADLVPLSDSASSGILKSLSWANIKVALFTAIGALTGKTTPVDADTLAISDSAASSVGKSLTLANLKKYILNSLTTAGDIFYATAAGVVARLPIGSTGNVLTVAGGVPTWAAPSSGAVKQLGQVVLAGAQATISFPTIDQTYSNLRIVWDMISPGGSGLLLCRFNADTTANYDSQQLYGNGATPGANEQFGATSMKAGSVNGVVASGQIVIPNYKGTTLAKTLVSTCFAKQGTLTGQLFTSVAGATWRSTAAITQIDFTNDAGNFGVGTVFTLYGES